MCVMIKGINTYFISLNPHQYKQVHTYKRTRLDKQTQHRQSTQRLDITTSLPQNIQQQLFNIFPDRKKDSREH